MEVFGYIGQTWSDKRLAKDTEGLRIVRESKMIWTPDAYCINCHETTMGDKLVVRVHPNGDVYYSQQ